MGAVDNLPAELLDYVMREFRGNSHCLKTSRLVCRKWSLAARRYSFANIKIDCKKVDPVVFFQCASIPKAAVESLQIIAARRRRAGVTNFNIKRIGEYIWCSCINVTTLSLHGMQRVSNNHLVAFLRKFPKLRCLNLSNVQFDFINEVIELMYAPPQLLEIHLRSIDLPEYNMGRAPELAISTNALRIRHISWEDVGTYDSELVDALERIQPPLEPWSIWCPEFDEELLDRYASSLRIIDFIGETFWDINPADFPFLHTIVIPPETDGELVPDSIIPSITSDVFQNLVLLLLVDPSRGIGEQVRGQHDWPVIEQGMPRFGRSAQVLVGIKWSGPGNGHLPPIADVEAEVVKLLPKCAELGMIRAYMHTDPVWDDFHLYGVQKW